MQINQNQLTKYANTNKLINLCKITATTIFIDSSYSYNTESAYFNEKLILDPKS